MSASTVRQSLPPVDADTLLDPVRAAAFWTGTLSPAAHLWLLVGGLGAGELPAFLALLAVNVVGLVAGRGHAD
ncbi:hypothetical protein [Halobaculum sp. MBLA0143]|uniref:hypothetical protein n=1 Tax=Halobaculum sp. MBLA0143 TaxID=3079933 RepID=UPI0035253BE4